MIDRVGDQRSFRWCVVDANVWVSRFVSTDVHHAASEEWLRRHLQAGGRIVAPTLLLVEVAGAISRRVDDPRRARRVVELLRSERGVRWVALTVPVSQQAAELAAALKLRGADAVYVAIAARLRIPLITLDAEQIGRAAPRIGVRHP